MTVRQAHSMQTYKIRVLNYDTTRRIFNIAIYRLCKSGKVEAIRKTTTHNFHTFARKNGINIIQMSPNYTRI